MRTSPSGRALRCGEVSVAIRWKPILVTAAFVGSVLVVDDATTARSGDFDRPTPPARSTALATAVPTANPTVIPTADPTADATGEPIPHRDDMGVIQTTGTLGRTVALTFDDGPSPKHTPEVLDILDQHDVKATFCLVGTSAKEHPELVKRIADRGHTLCDHTNTHDLELADRTQTEVRTEIGSTVEYIRAAVPDAEVPFYRAPGGNFSADVIAIAAAFGQQPLGWSVDPRDWTDSGADEIRTTVLELTAPGSVVLLHDGGGDQSETVDALDGIIAALRAAGYEFVIPSS
jgi:peptidoglycan/xylan/chitin deacetylase (PgdA/CDA1 family)